jgi:tetratricopeptide (TPR) repeat protein
MIRRVNGCRPWLLAPVVLAALAALATALPAAAQSTGIVKGVVKDDKGKPVDGAKITIEFQDGVNRKFEGKSDKKGEFLQIGLQPGSYKVTAEKDKLIASEVVRIRIGSTSETALTLGANAAAGSAEAAKKNADLKKAFDEGVAASRAGNQDDSIAAFTRAIEINGTCYDCYYNIGYAQGQKKDYEKAEAAYKKAIELKPDYSEAYAGLANVYNAQRKFDEAAAASAKATELVGGGTATGGGGGSPDASFNQGVILWNAGKVAEAKKAFEAVVAANPNHAEAHYQLGMALVNEGNLAGAATEFETYLKIAPAGPNAAQAKALVAQLKK